MIVFVVGMPRSGSTFSFNVARDVLARRGTVYQEATESVRVLREHAGTADHLLMKAHNADAETIDLVQSGGIRAICTSRKPEDAIASWMESFGASLEDSIPSFRRWFEVRALVRDRALMIDYRMIETEPRAAATAIARFVCPEADDSEIETVAARHSKAAVFYGTANLQKDGSNIRNLGFSYYDATTFYHRRHVLNLQARTATERIGAEAVQRIREAFANYAGPDGELTS